MELKGQDERLAKLLEESDEVLRLDRERGVVISTECYKTLKERMQVARAAAGKGVNQLKKFSAATDLSIILGAARRELESGQSVNGLVNNVRKMLNELSKCPGITDGHGQSLLTEEMKTKILLEARDGACKDVRRFSLVSGELNAFVEWLVANKVEEATGVKLPERMREKYRLQPEKRAFCAR